MAKRDTGVLDPWGVLWILLDLGYEMAGLGCSSDRRNTKVYQLFWGGLLQFTWAAITITIDWVAHTANFFFLIVLEARSPISRCWLIQFLVRSCFLTFQESTILLCVHMLETEIISLMSPLIKALIPFTRVLSSCLNFLTKAPLPNIITLGIRASSN